MFWDAPDASDAEVAVLESLRDVLPHQSASAILSKLRAHGGSQEAALNAFLADASDEGPIFLEDSQDDALEEEIGYQAPCSEGKLAEAMAAVRAVLPDADEAFLKDRVLEAGLCADRAIAAVMESGKDYPRRPRAASVQPAGRSSAAAEPSSASAAPGAEYWFSKEARSKEKLAGQYKELARKLLAEEFVDFSQPGIYRVFERTGNLYALAWRELYQAMGELLARRPLPKPLKALTRPRPKGGSRTGKAISCRKLRAESAFVESWREKESQDSSRKAALALHRQHCAQAGLMLECECCYAEELEEQIVQCTVGHLFCFACVSTYVGTRLGEGGPEAVLRLGCPSTSGCTEALPPSQLRRGLPEKLLKSYEARLEKASIELALSSENAASSSSSSSSSSRGALGDSSNGRLEQCPFCDFAMVMDALPEDYRIFQCQSEHCGKESCRLCKEISHIPLRCDEAKEKLDKDKVKDDYRVSVEEKMSEALIRECRPCKTKGITSRFVKEDGCNKMTCPKCKGWTCYQCSEPIPKTVSYAHFCQHPVSPGKPCQKCSSCPLWSKDLSAEEARRVSEAALAADSEFREAHGGQTIDALALLEESRRVIAGAGDGQGRNKRRRH